MSNCKSQSANSSGICCNVYKKLQSARRDIDQQANRIKELDSDLEKELIQRDYWEEKATELAMLVGEYLKVDVGERSNMNCPVRSAIEAIQEA